uniref:Uncharacterized protein n=1 Tax=Anguilla anguilla TaxID=7936 RepID=A0A0E9Q4V3_ANGAN
MRKTAAHTIWVMSHETFYKKFFPQNKNASSYLHFLQNTLAPLDQFCSA